MEFLQNFAFGYDADYLLYARCPHTALSGVL